jgi:hypothetical protein
MARTLRIDFVRRPWRIERGAFALFGVAALLGAAALWQVRSGREANAALEAELATQQRAGQQAVEVRAQSTIGPERTRAINDAIRRLNLPWEDILVALNKAASPQVALLALEPEPSNSIIKLQAEAKSFEAMLAYQRDLEALFPEAILTRHEVLLKEPGTPVRFSIQTRWGP